MFMWWKQGISVNKLLSEFEVNSCVKAKMTGLLRHHCSATLPPGFASVFVYNCRLAQLQLRYLLHTNAPGKCMCTCECVHRGYYWLRGLGLGYRGPCLEEWYYPRQYASSLLVTVHEGRESKNAEGWRETERSMLRFSLHQQLVLLFSVTNQGNASLI